MPPLRLVRPGRTRHPRRRVAAQALDTRRNSGRISGIGHGDLPSGVAMTPHPDRAREAAIHILCRLREAGHTAFLAGGCVRDELLGLTPKDYDIATDATPHMVRSYFPRTQEVGAAFGVVLVHVDSCTIEVATFRSDGPYSDRRRPDAVIFSDARSDALRRDFTINALFLDPLAESPEARVIDYVHGVDDLRARVVRAVGNPHARLAEDHLRALRAVRLSARLGFELEDATAEAIRLHARELAGVSRERIGDELRRMLTHPSRAVAAWTLQYLGLDAPALNDRANLNAPVRLGRIGDDTPYATALAAWLFDRTGGEIGTGESAETISRWRQSLCLTNEETTLFRGIVTDWRTLRREWWNLGVARQKRLSVRKEFLEALRILGTTEPEEFVRIRRRVEELRATPSGLAPAPLVSGDDLVQWGYLPSPGFKVVLESVYDAQLEDRVRTAAEAAAFVQELASNPGVGLVRQKGH